MRTLLFYCFIVFCMQTVSAQTSILIIQNPDTFMIYHLHLNEQLTTADLKVYSFDEFPQTTAKVSAYSGGKLSGIEKTYYPSGQVYQTFVYANDKLWGEYMEYTEDGKLQVRGNFINDQQHGVWIDSISGCTGRYKNGQKHGRWRCNEGKIPFKLYVYRKGVLKRSKQK
jgi:hypothetical protein